MTHIPVSITYPTIEEAREALGFIIDDFQDAGLVFRRDWDFEYGQPNKLRPAGWYIARYDLKMVRSELVPKRNKSRSRHRNVNVYE